MKKRFSPKQLLPSKKVIMAIAAAACVTAFSIGGVHYYNTNLKETATTATYYNQYLAASGADEVITDQVKDCLRRNKQMLLQTFLLWNPSSHVNPLSRYLQIFLNFHNILYFF